MSSSSENDEQDASSNPQSFIRPVLLAELKHLDLIGRVSIDNATIIASRSFTDIAKIQCTLNDRRNITAAVKRLRFYSKEDIGLIFEKEIYVWSKLKHPNILPLLGFAFEESSGYPLLVSEWMKNGTSLDYVRNNNNCDLIHLVSGIADGLEYLHMSNLVHSNIDPDSIVVTESGDARICDFGGSCIDHASKRVAKPSVGIPTMSRYVSYELVAFPDQYSTCTKDSDVWAFGMTAFALTSQEHPYSLLEDSQVLKAIIDREMPSFSFWTPRSSEEKAILKNVCYLCWEHDPSRRADMAFIAASLRDTEWFKDGSRSLASHPLPLHNSDMTPGMILASPQGYSGQAPITFLPPVPTMERSDITGSRSSQSSSHRPRIPDIYDYVPSPPSQSMQPPVPVQPPHQALPDVVRVDDQGRLPSGPLHPDLAGTYQPTVIPQQPARPQPILVVPPPQTAPSQYQSPPPMQYLSSQSHVSEQTQPPVVVVQPSHRSSYSRSRSRSPTRVVVHAPGTSEYDHPRRHRRSQSYRDDSGSPHRRLPSDRPSRRHPEDSRSRSSSPRRRYRRGRHISEFDEGDRRRYSYSPERPPIVIHTGTQRDQSQTPPQPPPLVLHPSRPQIISQRPRSRSSSPHFGDPIIIQQPRPPRPSTMYGDPSHGQLPIPVIQPPQHIPPHSQAVYPIMPPTHTHYMPDESRTRYSSSPPRMHVPMVPTTQPPILIQPPTGYEGYYGRAPTVARVASTRPRSPSYSRLDEGRRQRRRSYSRSPSRSPSRSHRRHRDRSRSYSRSPRRGERHRRRRSYLQSRSPRSDESRRRIREGDRGTRRHRPRSRSPEYDISSYPTRRRHRSPSVEGALPMFDGDLPGRRLWHYDHSPSEIRPAMAFRYNLSAREYTTTPTIRRVIRRQSPSEPRLARFSTQAAHVSEGRPRPEYIEGHAGAHMTHPTVPSHRPIEPMPSMAEQHSTVVRMDSRPGRLLPERNRFEEEYHEEPAANLHPSYQPFMVVHILAALLAALQALGRRFIPQFMMSLDSVHPARPLGRPSSHGTAIHSIHGARPSVTGDFIVHDALQAHQERLEVQERRLEGLSRATVDAEVRREQYFKEHEEERQRLFQENEERRIREAYSPPIQSVVADTMPQLQEILDLLREQKANTTQCKEAEAEHFDIIRDQITEARAEAKAECEERIMMLEQESARAREDLELERGQRRADEEERIERERADVIERDEAVRWQLSDITSIVQEQREDFLRMRDLVEERWQEKQSRREDKAVRNDEIREILYQILKDRELERLERNVNLQTNDVQTFHEIPRPDNGLLPPISAKGLPPGIGEPVNTSTETVTIHDSVPISKSIRPNIERREAQQDKVKYYLGNVSSNNSVIANDIANRQLGARRGLYEPYAKISMRLNALDQSQYINTLYEVYQYLCTARKVVASLHDVFNKDSEVDEKLDHLMCIIEVVLGLVTGSAQTFESQEQTQIIIRLLQQIIECCLFVKHYSFKSNVNFIGDLQRELTVFEEEDQALDISSGRTMAEFISFFVALKQALETGTGLLPELVSSRVSHVINNLLLRQRLNPKESDIEDQQLCLPGTRVVVQERIIEWMLSGSSQNILWLYGASGSGKSAVTASIAEHFRSINRLGAFLKLKRGSSDHHSIIPTIVFKLALFDSMIESLILAETGRDTDNVNASLAKQFEKLLLEPLTAAESTMSMPVIIILDGLDACGTPDEREAFLQVFLRGLPRIPSSFRFLISSRREKDIRRAFTLQPKSVTLLELDYTSTDCCRDVQFYLDHEMCRVFNDKRNDLDEESLESIKRIVSGHFDWASKVIKLVKEDANPLQKLEELASANLFEALNLLQVIRDDVLDALRRFDLSKKVNLRKRKIIGTGAFSEVFKVYTPRTDNEKGGYVAAKQLRFYTNDLNMIYLFENEIYVWSKLKHPNILPLLGFVINEENGYPLLITEWMPNGSAGKYVRANNDCDLLRLVTGVATGLSYLHENNVTHSDLKPENILVSSSGDALICDFGAARIIVASKDLKSFGAISTLHYMACELFADSDETINYSPPTDVWAFGMTVYELLAQKVPYHQYRIEHQVRKAIREKELPTLPEMSDWSSQRLEAKEILWDILQSCWEFVPSKRPDMVTVKDILHKHMEKRGRSMDVVVS